MIDIVYNSLKKLILYCKTQNWIGYDPFDGLNSNLFQALPVLKSKKFCRLAFLQLNKNSPFNFRQLLQVNKGRNPKGIGLFLYAAANLYRITREEEYMNLARQLINWLKQDISFGYSGCSWGYNFDWQSRAFFLPRGTPTVVNTSYIGRAFYHAYKVFKRDEYLEIANSACEFIQKDLNRWEDDRSLCFSYSPVDRYFVHNATALASSLLSLVYKETKKDNYIRLAKKSIQYVIDHQQSNGLWYYGEDRVAQKTGIDSFHTGFILECLKIYSKAAEDNEYDEYIIKGLDFYQNNFFLIDGIPKYYINKTYPVDIHSAAQAIVTLMQLEDFSSDLGLCDRIVNWMIEKMQDKKGYFYYQKRKYFTNKIAYMRWSQAWALYALTTYLDTNG